MAMEEMQLNAILPELILIGGSVIGLVTGLFIPKDRQWLIALLTAFTLALACFFSYQDLREPAGTVFFNTYTVDVSGRFGSILILSAAILVIGLSYREFRQHMRETEFYVLLLFATLGLVLLTGISDLMFLMVAYLLSSIPLYTLTAFHKNKPGTEAAMKYLLMGALLGIIMLYGMALFYGAGGATTFAGIYGGLSEPVTAIASVALGMVMAGLVFKMGSVPGHFWVPDVTEGAPIPVAAYVTTVPKIAAVIITVRILTELVPGQLIAWPLFIAILSAITMTLGNLAALWQNSVRRLLAYSSISQVGYILMAVAVAGKTENATSALLFYLLAYAFMNIGAFAVIASIKKNKVLNDYSGLFKEKPLLAISLSICLLSMVGIPPLGGFIAKLGVFSVAWDGGFAWLTVLAAVNTVISIFYYLRWLLPVYFKQPKEQSIQTFPMAMAVTYLAALITIALGLTGPLI